MNVRPQLRSGHDLRKMPARKGIDAAAGAVPAFWAVALAASNSTRTEGAFAPTNSGRSWTVSTRAREGECELGTLAVGGRTGLGAAIGRCRLGPLSEPDCVAGLRGFELSYLEWRDLLSHGAHPEELISYATRA